MATADIRALSLISLAEAAIKACGAPGRSVGLDSTIGHLNALAALANIALKDSGTAIVTITEQDAALLAIQKTAS